MMKQKKSKWPALIKYLVAIPFVLLLAILFQSQVIPEESSKENLAIADNLEELEYVVLLNGKETIFHDPEFAKYKGLEILSCELAKEKFGNIAQDKKFVLNYLDSEDHIMHVDEGICRIYMANGKKRVQYNSYTTKGYNLDQPLMNLIHRSELELYQLFKIEEGQSRNGRFIINFLKTQEQIPSIIPIRKEHLKKNIDKVFDFGESLHPIHKVNKKHKGIDLIADQNSPVYASANGKVAEVKSDDEFGNQITIEHNNVHSTFYAHLSAFHVVENDEIKKGQLIGSVGSTGKSTAPHLHYEVRSKGKVVDPMPYLRQYIKLDQAERSDTLPVHNGWEMTKYNQDELFKVVQEMPRFPGCEDIAGTKHEKENCAKDKLLSFIYSNLTYPTEAIADRIDGTNVVQFIVEKDGSISDLNLVRDIGGSTGEATMNVIKKMQENFVWKPGYQKGEAVRVLFTLPVKFKLLELDTTPFNEIKQESPMLLMALGDATDLTELEVAAKEGIDPGPTKMEESEKQVFIIDGIDHSTGPINIDFEVEKITELYGENAVRKYGPRAKYGAIEVISKNKVDEGNIVKYEFENNASIANSSYYKGVSNIGVGSEDSIPFIIIDGVKQGRLSRGIEEKVKFDQIESINVLRGDAARLKSGDGGVDIVLEVITKGSKTGEEYMIVNNQPEEIYRVVEEMPRFPGCENLQGNAAEKEECAKNELLKFVYQNLNYPKTAREQGIDGMAVVQFIIDKRGQVVNPRVVMDADGYFEEPVMAVINELVSQEKIWTPGKQKGDPVNVLFTLPVKFVLEQIGVNKEDQPSQEIKSLELEDPNEIATMVTGLAPSKVFNITSTSTLTDVTIDYYTDVAGPVNVSLFNTSGQLLKTETLNVLEGKNTHTVRLNANVAGIYIVTITQGQSKSSRKIFLK